MLELDKSDREAAKASIAKAKAINPVSLDALALSGAVAYIEDRHADLQQEAAAALKINPRFSGAYRVAGGAGGGELPVRGSGGVEPQGARDRSERRPHALGAGRAAPAHGRRGRSAPGAREIVRDRQVRSDDVQPADDARLAGQVRHDDRRQHRLQEPSERNAGHARVRGAARAAGARDLLGEVQVHAARGRF